VQRLIFAFRPQGQCQCETHNPYARTQKLWRFTSAEKLGQLASIGKPASNDLLEIEGYLRVQIDIRFVHEPELKPILADRPLIDMMVLGGVLPIWPEPLIPLKAAFSFKHAHKELL
jgi:hypothetical protein